MVPHKSLEPNELQSYDGAKSGLKNPSRSCLQLLMGKTASREMMSSMAEDNDEVLGGHRFALVLLYTSKFAGCADEAVNRVARKRS